MATTDPFLKMAEEIEADEARNAKARATGKSVTTIPGDPGAIVTTETEAAPAPLAPPDFTGTPDEARSRFSQPSRTSFDPAPKTIERAARDPFIVAAEKVEFEEEMKRREPDFTKNNPGFVGRSLSRMASGFNAVIADLTGDTLEGVDYVLRDLGMRLFENPKTARKQVHDWMNKQGMATARISGVAGGLGQAAPEGFVMAAAWLAAAPSMVALKGNNAVSRFVKGFGETIQKYPGLIVAQEVGSTLGARAGAEQAADAGAGPTGQFLGGLVGAIGGGSLATAVSGVGRAALRAVGIGRTRDAFVAPGAPPIREAADPQQAKLIGERMVAGERTVLEQQLRTTIDNVSNLAPRDPGMASRLFREELEQAADMGRAMERTLWRTTAHAKSAQTPTDDIFNLFTAMRAEVAEHGRSNTLPNLLMRQFERRNLTPAVPAAPTGVLGPGGAPIMSPGSPAAPRPITIGRLLGYHSDLIKAMAFERKAPARGRVINSELIQNLARIDERVLDTIQRALPNDTTIAAARTFSRAFNDMFTRGPVAQVRGMAGRNEAIVPPELAVQKILSTYQGGDQVARIGREIPMSQGVRAQFEQAVRSEFREIAETGGPVAASRFMAKVEPSITNLATLRGDLMQASDDLISLTAAKKTVEGSALAKFSSLDSDAAIRRLMADPSSPAEARAIMATLGRDPAAVQAFQAGVVDHFVRNAHGFPSKIRAQLDNPRIARTMAEIFTPAQNARFNRLIDMGVRIERGDETFLQKLRRGGLPIIAAIFGAQSGRTLAKFTGGGTVQTPGLIAGVSRRWVTDSLLGIPLPELMARAVLDPRWERILLSRVPETTKESRKFISNIKRLIRVESAAMAVDYSPKGGQDE